MNIFLCIRARVAISSYVGLASLKFTATLQAPTCPRMLFRDKLNMHTNCECDWGCACVSDCVHVLLIVCMCICPPAGKNKKPPRGENLGKPHFPTCKAPLQLPAVSDLYWNPKWWCTEHLEQEHSGVECARAHTHAPTCTGTKALQMSAGLDEDPVWIAFKQSKQGAIETIKRTLGAFHKSNTHKHTSTPFVYLYNLFLFVVQFQTQNLDWKISPKGQFLPNSMIKSLCPLVNFHLL